MNSIKSCAREGGESGAGTGRETQVNQSSGNTEIKWLDEKSVFFHQTLSFCATSLGVCAKANAVLKGKYARKMKI